jgi:cell division protein ZapD
MAEVSWHLIEEDSQNALIAFEQPLTERMRTFLRLEFLYDQASMHCKHESAYGARAAIASLLEILAITGRGDVRADVLKELDRHARRLNHYENTPGVDGDRLSKLLREVDQLRGSLSAAGKQFLAPLRDNEFLNAIRHRSAIPGGTCMFDLPDFGYWLQLPSQERTQQIKAWMQHLQPLCAAINRVLWLTRESTTAARHVAAGGLYKHSLGKDDNVALVRVLIERDSLLYPEISAGQHRFTVRFARWQGTENRPRQAVDDVSFLLALC